MAVVGQVVLRAGGDAGGAAPVAVGALFDVDAADGVGQGVRVDEVAQLARQAQEGKDEVFWEGLGLLCFLGLLEWGVSMRRIVGRN